MHSLTALKCPDVLQHPGSRRWQFHYMYEVRRMPQVLQNMAKIPRSSTTYQTGTANKQHLMANIWYTTRKLHSYISLRNQDCKRKLQSKFQEQHLAYCVTSGDIWSPATPRALHSLLLQKTISLNQLEPAGPRPATHMTMAEVKQHCLATTV